jgi:hypothetical protein
MPIMILNDKGFSNGTRRIILHHEIGIFAFHVNMSAMGQLEPISTKWLQ